MTAVLVPLQGAVRCVVCWCPATALWVGSELGQLGPRAGFNEASPCGCRTFPCPQDTVPRPKSRPRRRRRG